MLVIFKDFIRFFKTTLTTIRLLLEKPLKDQRLFLYYNKIADCQHFYDFVLLNEEISKLSETRYFDFKDEILLRQALRIKNYEFNITQMQDDIGMLQLTMVLSMDQESLDPLSSINIEAQRTKEYEKVEEGEIHNVKDICKQDK